MEDKRDIKEILRQQLELLAEVSKMEANYIILPQLTSAMMEIARMLDQPKFNQ